MQKEVPLPEEIGIYMNMSNLYRFLHTRQTFLFFVFFFASARIAYLINLYEIDFQPKKLTGMFDE